MIIETFEESLDRQITQLVNEYWENEKTKPCDIEAEALLIQLMTERD